MGEKRPLIIAVDFDGTLCSDCYPEIGNEDLHLISLLKILRASGTVLILYTCRRDQYLTDAVEWCKARGLEFDYINENDPHIIGRYGGDTRKIFADIYLDDKSSTPQMLKTSIATTTRQICAAINKLVGE